MRNISFTTVEAEHYARPQPETSDVKSVETASWSSVVRAVGAGWVTWAAGPSGGVVPIPRSISYAAAEQGEFMEFHERVVAFLRGPHAARYLWPHLKDKADEMMNSILNGFNE